MAAKLEENRKQKLRQKALDLREAGFSSRATAGILKISQPTVMALWNNPQPPPKPKPTLAFEELTEGQQNQVLRFREYEKDGEGIERRYIENIAEFRLHKWSQKNVRTDRSE